eukprot:1879748-Alexandrium_andersonii.AAC.1
MRIGESSSAGLQSAKKTSGTRGHCCSPPGRRLCWMIGHMHVVFKSECNCHSQLGRFCTLAPG